MSAVQSPQSQSRVKAVQTLDWNSSHALFGAGNDAATQSSHFSASAKDMVELRHPRKITSCSAHGLSLAPNVGALEGGSDSTAATGTDDGESLTIVAVGARVVGVSVAVTMLVGVPVAGALLTGVPVVLMGVGAAVCALLSATIRGAMIKPTSRMMECSNASFNNWSYMFGCCVRSKQTKAL